MTTNQETASPLWNIVLRTEVTILGTYALTRLLTTGSDLQQAESARSTEQVAVDAHHVLQDNFSAYNDVINIPGKPYEWYEAPKDIQKPSAEVIEDFEQKTDNQPCGEIDAVSAATTYHQLFELDPYKDMTPADLTAAAKSAANQYEQLKEEVEMVPLPATYQHLKENVWNEDQEVPVTEYIDALNSMLAAFNVSAVYDATTGREGASVLTQDEWNGQDIKPNILDLMKDLATLPKQEVIDSGLSVIYFSKQDGAVGSAGLMENRTPYLQLDLTGYDSTVFNHELAHAMDFGICYGKDDPTWTSMNPQGFKYSRKKDERSIDGVGYLNIESQIQNELPGEAVTITEYGANNKHEDWAEVASRITSPEKTWQLTTAGARDVIDKKAAIYIEREAARSPEIAAFYKGRIALASLQQRISETYGGLNRAYYKRYYEQIERQVMDGKTLNHEDQDFYDNGPKPGTQAYADGEELHNLYGAMELLDQTLMGRPENIVAG